MNNITINFEQKTISPKVAQNQVNVELSGKQLDVGISQKQINVNTVQKQLEVDVKKTLTVVPTQHSDLTGLDYESSGHTGFASEKQLSLLVPKSLSVLPKSSLSNRVAKMYLDNNGIAEQASLQDILDLKIRTVDKVPNDLKNGDYIFLEIK